MENNYEIYLDESGDFEKFSRELHRGEQREPIRLIGGIIVPTKLNNEQNHLRNKLINSCNSLPDTFKTKINENINKIHIGDDEFKKAAGLNLYNIINNLLNIFNDDIPEAKILFIYELEELHAEERPAGAQLYRHMLIKLLETILFYHPKFNKNDTFSVNLAHRRFTYPESCDKVLPDQGYLKLKDKKGLTQYTAITPADLNSIMHHIKSSLGFKNERSAVYNMKPYGNWDNPFMVMADLVCNQINHLLIKYKKAADIHNALQRLFPDRLLFYCNLDYDVPKKLLEAFHQGQYGKFLASYTDLSESRDFIADNYLLGNALEKAISDLKSLDKIDEFKIIVNLADKLVDERRFNRLKEVKQLLGHVESKFSQISNQSYSDPNWDELTYKFHDVCLRHSNHTANTFQGKYHKDLGIKIFNRLSSIEVTQLRRYHEFINRASVTDTNEFAFERAIARLMPIKEKEEELAQMLANCKNTVLGKIYGSLGQNYSFLKNYDEASCFFDKAKNHLGEDNPMQASFRAHLALDRNENDKYEKELCLLFKRQNILDYNELLNESLDNIAIPGRDFSLHLLLKGILVFDYSTRDEIVKNLYNKLKDINYLNRTTHPWELIYLVLARLLQKTDYYGVASLLWDKSANFAKDKDQMTFIMIGHSARAWEALYWLERNKVDKAVNLLKQIKAEFEKIGDKAPGIYNPNKIQDYDGIARPGWFDEIGKKILDSQLPTDKDNLKKLLEEFLARFTYNYW